MVLEVIHGDLDGQDRHRTPPRPLRKSASLLRAPNVLEQLKNSKISDEKFKNVLFALEQTLFLSMTHSYAALQCNKIILCGARARRARRRSEEHKQRWPARTRALNNQRIGSLEQFTDSRVSLKMYPVMKCHVFWGICFRCDQRNSRFRNDYVCWRAKQSLKIVNHRLLHSDLNTAKTRGHIQMYMPTGLCIWLENVNLPHLTTNWSSLFLMLILKSCNMFFKGKYS